MNNLDNINDNIKNNDKMELSIENTINNIINLETIPTIKNDKTKEGNDNNLKNDIENLVIDAESIILDSHHLKDNIVNNKNIDEDKNDMNELFNTIKNTYKDTKKIFKDIFNSNNIKYTKKYNYDCLDSINFNKYNKNIINCNMNNTKNNDHSNNENDDNNVEKSDSNEESNENEEVNEEENEEENEEVNEEENEEANEEENEEENEEDNEEENETLLSGLVHLFDNVYSYGRCIIENNYINFSQNDDINEVYPNIYISNYSTSTNLNLLKEKGITTIITILPVFNPPYPEEFNYLHIKAYDDLTQNLTQYFDITNALILKCLKSHNEAVLIHCMAGRSRSITIFIAFLINIIKNNINQNEFYNKPISISPNYSNMMNYIQKLQHEYINYNNNKPSIKDGEIDLNDINKFKVNDILFYNTLVVTKIINYIKLYRNDIEPNTYFIKQLIQSFI